MTQKHRDYTEYLLKTVRDINPYMGKAQGQAWAIGFLASNLADILMEDPRLLRRYQRRLEHVAVAHKSSRPR